MENSQILIVGKYHEHIFTIIEHYNPNEVNLISSFSLEIETISLRQKIMKKDIKCEIYLIDPFTENTVNQMIETINIIINRIRKENKSTIIYLGLTGLILWLLVPA